MRRLTRRLAPIAAGLGALLAATASFAGARIALTFDDLPAHGPLAPGETRLAVGRSILATLKAAPTPPVYGFVNGVQTQREPASTAVLDAWRAAGFPLGNHTWSHLNLNTAGLAAWEADVVRDEADLRRRMAGGDWRWLRFPFLAEGGFATEREGARAFLAAHGYRIAPVTMSFDDYAFNAPYARCVAKRDVAAVTRLETAYLAAADAELARAQAMSRAATGRDIPFVLLLHLGAFDARMLPRLLALYRSHDVSFVSLPEAVSDPFYAPDVQLGSTAPDTLEAALAARGLPVPAKRPDLAWLGQACR